MVHLNIRYLVSHTMSHQRNHEASALNEFFRGMRERRDKKALRKKKDPIKLSITDRLNQEKNRAEFLKQMNENIQVAINNTNKV